MSQFSSESEGKKDSQLMTQRATIVSESQMSFLPDMKKIPRRYLISSPIGMKIVLSFSMALSMGNLSRGSNLTSPPLNGLSFRQ